MEAEDDALRLNAAKSESISPFSSSITPDKSPYISEPAPASWIIDIYRFQNKYKGWTYSYLPSILYIFINHDLLIPH